MGKVLSVGAREVRNFNVENRAHKVISQSKPKPAPKYEANVKELERVLRDHPELIEQAGRKDAGLDNRLKQVWVNSSDYLEQRRIINPERPLPLNKKYVSDFEFGFKETEVTKVAPGKCTLRQAIQFLTDNQLKPEVWTAEKIAAELNLKLDNVESILEHFRMFQVHIPEKKEGNTKQFLIRPFKDHGSKEDFDKLLEGSKKKY